jgi:hypothetical protein
MFFPISGVHIEPLFLAGVGFVVGLLQVVFSLMPIVGALLVAARLLGWVGAG